MNETPDEMCEIRERQVELDARLSGLERTSAEIIEEVKKLSAWIRGNGEHGLFGQVQLTQERLAAFQRQWKWVLGLLGALVAGLIQAILRG